MATPGLLSLPVSVRKRIYYHAGLINQNIDALENDHTYAPALSCVNRQLHGEIIPLWRAENTFVLNPFSLGHHDQIIWIHHHEKHKMPLPKTLVMIETYIMDLYPDIQIYAWPKPYFGGDCDAYKCDVFLYTKFDLTDKKNLKCFANCAFVDHWGVTHWTWPDRDKAKVMLCWQQRKWMEGQSLEWMKLIEWENGFEKGSIKREWVDGSEFEELGPGRAGDADKFSEVRKAVVEDVEAYVTWSGSWELARSVVGHV